MSQVFTHDVFLSHSSKDKPAVRELAERLKRDGLRVWLDEWEIEPGESIPPKIEQGLETSRTLVLVMSRNAFASDWVTLERHTALFRDPTNEQRRFIPLCLDDAPINDALRQFAYVDWRKKAADEYAKLLAACRPPGAPDRPLRDKPGSLYLSRVLKGHGDQVWGIAPMPDGRRAVSGSSDGTMRVWDLDTGKCLATADRLATAGQHEGVLFDVAVTPDGKRAVVACEKHGPEVWDLSSGARIATLRGHRGWVQALALSADGRRIASGGRDKTVRLWDLDSGSCILTLRGHTSPVRSLAFAAGGRRLVSAATDHTARVWDTDSGKCLVTFRGHTSGVNAVSVTSDDRWVVSGSDDDTVQVWELDSGKAVARLEGHTGYGVHGVAVTRDGGRAVSAAWDSTVRVWDLISGKCVAIARIPAEYVHSVAITPDSRRIVSSSDDSTVRVWDMPPVAAVRAVEPSATARYTNAKVLLVGDSGVGKSGLAIRLIEDRFEPTISTDAVWATQMSMPHAAAEGGVDREIWLWDFAGQADYRLIHQLFMDETALALLVFNPQSENPFEGLGQWDRDLARAARRDYRKLLVAGRCDRGGLTVSRSSIEEFGRERGFEGYLETSAQSGDGCKELRDAIPRYIDWKSIPWTASPRIFKLLKDEIIKLRDEGRVLLRMAELKQQLEMRLPDETFTIEELRAVVRLLVGPGVVWNLEFGGFVLLRPELINAYAAAVIRSVRAHKDEIGCILEEDVLAGRLNYEDMERLPREEEEIVLRAMHQTFVDHGLCLREQTEAGTQLVFPSYYRRERPELEGHPAVFVTYQFSGQLHEIYATLIVRLHNTTAFEKDQLWRFAADFKTPSGKRLGLKMARRAEGAGEISVYLGPAIPDDAKVTFIKYVHEHILGKDPEVARIRHYICPNDECGEPVESVRAIKRALERGQQQLPCQFCNGSIPLWDLIEEKFASDEALQRVREMEEQSRASIDNESRELILVGHAFAIAGEAGQIFRPVPNSDWGIDGEIEFKDYDGKASGRRVYLQLKSGDSYLYKRRHDGVEVFTIRNPRHAEYWQQQAYPVMLVIRTSDGEIRWMDVSAYLKEKTKGRKRPVKRIVFEGEEFSALSLRRLRDRVIPYREAA